MQEKLQDIRGFITSEQNITQHEVDRIQQEIETIQVEADFINLVPRSKNERFWILSSETGQLGFLPATGNHELVIATKNPSESNILKIVALHPSSKSTNVPLSIKNIILYADKLGLNDDSLLQCLLMYLKKCKPEIYYAVSPKKNNIKSLMDSLALYSSTEDEKNKTQSELAKFVRQPGELFPEAIAQFDTLYCHLECIICISVRYV